MDTPQGPPTPPAPPSFLNREVSHPLLWGGLSVVLLLLMIGAAYFSSELTTQVAGFRVTVSPREVLQGGSIQVRWPGNPDHFPFEQILICAARGRSCRVLLSATPNDGAETITNLNVSPGRYVIELRALDRRVNGRARARTRSNRFTVVSSPEPGGGDGGGGGDSGGGGGGGTPPPPPPPPPPYGPY